MRFALGILVALLVMTPRTSVGQTANPPSGVARISVDVNLLGMAASLANDRRFQSRFLKFGEIGSSFATYPEPSLGTPFPLLDVGGSFMLTRWLGVGATYSRTIYEDDAGLSATIPHPTFYGAAATNIGATGEQLTRREAATNIFLAIVPVRTTRAEWRLVGGPTIISLKADMVNEVLYEQTYVPTSPQQTITINGFTTSEVTANDLGVHVGSDFTFFFTKFVGVGGGVRFSYGTVTLEQEPLSKVSQEIRVGNTLVFLGVRFRIGG
jgi:hypothetical protein